MLKNYTILLFCIAVFGMSTSLSAQTAEGCDNNRYFLDVFDNTTKTTVKFGENTTAAGANQELFMDIYEPVGDNLDKRPLIVWAFGGAFVAGERETMEQNCIDFAKKGYVAATIDYRLWSIFTQGIPDSLQMLENAVRAMADMKAAIRHFRQDAATDNLYKIDPDYIFVGGVSAGAITAMNTAYIDDNDVIPDYLQEIVDRNGGLEGDTGDSTNLSYSSETHAAINLSGALHKLDWLDADDPPFISFHGDDDLTVPYRSGNAIVLGFRFMSLHGSGSMKDRADEVGVDNYLLTVPGGGHEDIYVDAAYEDDRINFYLNGHNFLHNVLCESFVLDTEEPGLQTRLIGLSPNPAFEQITLDVGEQAGSYDVGIYDQLGRLVQQFNNVRDRQLALESAKIGKGMFVVRVDFRDQPFAPVTRKILFH